MTSLRPIRTPGCVRPASNRAFNCHPPTPPLVLPHSPASSMPELPQAPAPSAAPFAGLHSDDGTAAPRLRLRGHRRRGPHLRPPRGAPRLVFGVLGSSDLPDFRQDFTSRGAAARRRARRSARGARRWRAACGRTQERRGVQQPRIGEGGTQGCTDRRGKHWDAVSSGSRAGQGLSRRVVRRNSMAAS
ncbi:hypothetical protein PVAP13_7NG016800 [Panicum virgatum]|uniref:Uncharacterized protein n=1 Tax=Panicum virgatum TaxID=38727 RepID=A0A8T0PU73_PANVG|nr:hypothetical protein PVAP13_7NG016800 [Panicum virgatum]